MKFPATPDIADQFAHKVELVATLTSREVEVITLVAKGYQTKMIGEELHISPKTVEKHRNAAYRKIGTCSVIHITHIMIANRIVKLGDVHWSAFHHDERKKRYNLLRKIRKQEAIAP